MTWFGLIVYKAVKSQSWGPSSSGFGVERFGFGIQRFMLQN